MEMIKMWFWWFIFCFNQLTPILMILGGRIMWKHSPKNINCIIGYRTSRSMKNIDTWLFAQKHCGKLWWKIGWIISVPSLLIPIPFYGASVEIIGNMGLLLIIVQTVILICSVFLTERALKEKFTDEGIRK